MELLISPKAEVVCLYDESLDLSALGRLSIRRASYVEPTDYGQWSADLSPVGGSVLGPFQHRSEALAAEVHWIEDHWPLIAT